MRPELLVRPAAVLACLLALAVPSAQAQTRPQPQPRAEVKIGSVSPLSGTGAHQGKDIENGARMAVDDLNAKGLTIGGRKITFVLQAEDDGADPKMGTAAAQKLVDDGVVAVVGHLNSGTTVPASKIYNSAGIPQISPAATTPLYTRQGYKTAFRVVASDSLVGRTLAAYAIDTLHARKIAVIDDRTAFGQGLADEFTKAVKAAGGAQIVSRQFTNDKAIDFNAILTQVRAHQPDVIFYGGMDAVAGPMLKQMKALGLQARFVSGDGVCSEKLPQLAGDALGNDKVFCVVAGGVTGAKEEAGFAAFTERYRQRYKIPLQTYAPYAYDATMVFAAAMQQANSTDPARFLPALAKISYHGVTGSIAFDPSGDLHNAALTLYTYRGGRQVKLRVVR
jgi:branched-chain amino acid transport system substrate-binding protein